MADISLDDFIKKKNLNVKVRLNNTKAGQGRQQQQQQGRKQQGNKQQLQRQNNGAGRVNGLGQQKPLSLFDARIKLGSKNVGDARDKIIINKKNGVGDARNKIVNIQVKKGTFDARSILQKNQKKSNGSGNAQGRPTNFTRTLSNPNAKNHAQIRTTPNGLTVTRRVPDTQVTQTGASLQVTRRNKQSQNIADAVPIIQIRNDKYRTPVKAPPPLPDYQAELQKHNPAYTYIDYDDPGATAASDPYASDSYTSDPYSSTAQGYHPQGAEGYRDWETPQYNTTQSVELPQGIHHAHLKTIEAAGMRPVAVSRAPPGAATVSQLPRQPAQRTMKAAAAAVAPSPGPALRLSASSLKRKQPPPPAADVSGPLRLGRGGGPGIDLDPSPVKKVKPAVAAAVVMGPDVEDSESDVISPLQGYRVMVTNLFNGVTQDDVIELFGAVGPLKKAKLLKVGSAEVVYSVKQHAVTAVSKYHGRELDGQPMYVRMTTPVTAVVKQLPNTDPDINGEALRLYSKPSAMGALPMQPVATPTLHRALFKVGPPGPNKSVKFTVKI